MRQQAMVADADSEQAEEHRRHNADGDGGPTEEPRKKRQQSQRMTTDDPERVLPVDPAEVDLARHRQRIAVVPVRLADCNVFDTHHEPQTRDATDAGSPRRSIQPGFTPVFRVKGQLVSAPTRYN
jgi:hypothetical protein